MEPSEIGGSSSAPTQREPRTSYFGRGEAWTRFLWERKLGTAWAICFALGALLIIYVPAERIDRFLLPVVVMAAYFVYGLGVQDKNTERFADSLYFMGFLWTLTALITALFGGRLTSTTVFKAFGYALITTAVGMLLRLLVIQFQETLADRVVHAQIEVDRTVSRFRDEVEKAADVIQRFRTSAETRLDEQARALTSALETIRTSIQTAHSEATQASVNSIGQAAGVLAARLREFHVPQTRIEQEATKVADELGELAEGIREGGARTRDQLAASGNTISGALAAMVERIAQVHLPADILTREMTQTALEIRRGAQGFSRELEVSASMLSQGIRSLSSALADMPGRSDAETALRTAADAVRRAGAGYHAMATAAEAANRHLAGMGAELGSIRSELAQLTRSLADLDANATRLTAEAVSHATNRLVDAETAVAQAQSAGLELHQAVSEVLAFVRERLRAPGVI